MRFKVFLVTLAILFFTKLYANDPLTEGFLLLEKGDYKSAFTIFSSIRNETPEVITAKGISKYFSKNYSDSIKFLEKSLKFPSEKNNWVTNYFAGLSYFELGKFSKALYYLNVSYALKQTPELTFWIGKTLYNMENYVEAEKYLLESLNSGYKTLEVYKILLSIYEKFENNSKIYEILEKAKKDLGNIPELSLYEAKLLTKKGDIEKAKKIVEALPKEKFGKEIEEIISLSPEFKKGESKFSKKILGYVKFTKSQKVAFLFLSTLIILITVGLFIKNRQKDSKEKLDFAFELLKNDDISGAEEILVSIRPPYPNNYSILKIKTLALKGEMFEALYLCDDLNNPKIKETFKALIYLLHDDLINFQKQIDYIEYTIDKQLALTLSELTRKDKQTIKKFFLNFNLENINNDSQE